MRKKILISYSEEIPYYHDAYGYPVNHTVSSCADSA